MADVTNELMYEVLKAIQARLGNMEEAQRETRGQLAAIRGGQYALQTHLSTVQLDVANIYQTLGALDTRIERIERRLDIIDTPAH